MIQADAEAAARRRKDAEAEASVDYRRRDDGLVDIFVTGLSGPNARAVLSRIRDYSTPVGSSDDGPAGKRRLDAFVDLILGRDRRTLDGELGSCATGHDTTGCGYPVGAPAPCGTDVQVLIPLGAALGVSGELAELVGHGPLDPDLTSEQLLAAPVLRPVWVNEAGVPVATGRTVQWPARRDIRGLGAALRRLAASRPGTFVPRHPDDHAGSAHDAAVLGQAALGRPQPDRVDRPRLLTRPHPTGTPGPYQVPDSLRQLLQVRRPRCEWPGCGSRCDLDHDRAWPHGPTCGCNLGPLCRRHHRIKQLGWTKTRTPDAAVRWMSPTGRSWTSPSPHRPPAGPDRRRRRSPLAGRPRRPRATRRRHRTRPTSTTRPANTSSTPTPAGASNSTTPTCGCPRRTCCSEAGDRLIGSRPFRCRSAAAATGRRPDGRWPSGPSGSRVGKSASRSRC